MPARLEQTLISYIVEHGAFIALEKNKITEDYFFDAQYKDAYQFLKEYYRRNGVTPDPTNMVAHRPNINFQWGVQDSIDGMCEQLRQHKIRSDMVGLSELIQNAANSGNPREALELLRTSAITMANEHVLSRDMLISDSRQTLLDRYEQSEASGGIIGIPWPWEQLSFETRGLQKGHFILIYGRPKHGKTWLAVLTAAHALVFARKRVLFYSMEMQEAEILERLVCAAAKVDYDEYYKGLLRNTNPEAFAHFWAIQDWLRQLRDHSIHSGDSYAPDVLATCDSSEGGGGITSLRAKIREFKPDLVVVDGIYLMKDDRGSGKNAKWDAMTNISRDLKKTAQMFDVPVVGVTQGNRQADKDHKQADLREIGYADAPGQDADLILRVDKRKTDNGETEIYVSVVGFRHGSGKLDCFSIHFHPCVNTEFHRIINADDSQAQQQPQTKASPKGRPSAVFLPNNFSGPGVR